jgi:hypothetical protein
MIGTAGFMIITGGKMNKGFMLIVLGIMLSASVLVADQWFPPSIDGYYSENEEYFFEVIPHYLVDPRGKLYEKGKDGEYHHVWTTRLVNSISPVSARLTNDGRYVVTFDNWAGVGYGDDVVVIYGPDGSMIEKFSLYDLAPSEVISEMGRTVSSTIFWGGFDCFDEEAGHLVLGISGWGEVRIVLATGKIIPRKD